METFSYYVQLDELFKECMKDLSAEEKGLFCKDGLMLKAYKTEKSLDTLWDESKRRVMFVLKDKNTPDGDDTRLWLLDGKNGEASRNLKGGNVGRTGFLPNIARMLYGLVVDTKGYDDLKGEMDKVVEVWNTIPFAFIEAKKRAGYSSVEKEEIEEMLSSPLSLERIDSLLECEEDEAVWLVPPPHATAKRDREVSPKSNPFFMETIIFQ